MRRSLVAAAETLVFPYQFRSGSFDPFGAKQESEEADMSCAIMNCSAVGENAAMF